MRRPIRLVVALLAVLALAAAACGDDDNGDTTGDTDETAPPSGPTIAIGAQDFGESAILAEIYSQALAANGYSTRIQTLGGFRDLELGAFQSGDINFAPEYVAAMLETLNDNAGEATSDVDESAEKLQEHLDERNLVALTPAPGVNTNVFVMTQERSTELDITALSDLPADGGDLRLGAPADCETNPFCIPGLQSVYGVDLSARLTPLDHGVTATALENNEIDIGVLFSTDGILTEDIFVVLDDDENMSSADNIVPVVTQALVDAYGEDFEALIDSISALLTTEELSAMNRAYEIERESPGDIARQWLEDNDLLP
jgi:osmoprotectant transport system substrate-binding protein